MALASLLALVGTAHSAPRRWAAPGNPIDTGSSIAVDAAGNSYTAGTSTLVAGNGTDVVLVARNPAGNIMWQRNYDGGLGADESAISVLLDGFGNVFVLASADNPGTGKDILVLKWTVVGVPVNRYYFNGAANGDDVARDFAYDPANFVVIAGGTTNAAGNMDTLVIRAMDNLIAAAFRTWNGAANSFVLAHLASCNTSLLPSPLSGSPRLSKSLTPGKTSAAK